jgi:hypothetical protein
MRNVYKDVYKRKFGPRGAVGKKVDDLELFVEERFINLKNQKVPKSDD